MLAGLGYGSRRQVAIEIRKGAFRIGGKTVTDPDAKLYPSQIKAETATFLDEPLDPLPPLTIMLNKPAGYVCSHEDAGPIVYDLLPSRYLSRKPQISVAGRLDKDTTGLVILTDDGTLAHRLISPKVDTPKIYEVELELPLQGSEPEIFASGELMLKGETRPLRPAEMEILGPHTARLTLHEGRYHQVRRMFASQNNTVIKLHRSRIGALDLGGLAEGNRAILSENEISLLFSQV